jgi:hypothetical protein
MVGLVIVVGRERREEEDCGREADAKRDIGGVGDDVVEGLVLVPDVRFAVACYCGKGG